MQRDADSNTKQDPPMSNHPMNSNLRNQLRYYMESKGLTAASIARQSGVPKQSLSGWLAGKKPADVSQIKRVADALGVSLDNLLFGHGKDTQAQKFVELDALLGDQWISGLFEVRFRRVKR